MTDDENDAVMSHEPTDRLTRLADEITAGLSEEGNEDVRAIVMLNDGKRGGIIMHGYDDTIDGVADLFIHMQAMFRSQGKQLELVSIPDSPEGLEEV